MGYRIIVCGGRDYTDVEHISAVIDEYRQYDPIIVHGDARGADTIAGQAALRRGLLVETHEAYWDVLGRRAGFERNERMAKLGADLCIAFPGGRGTASMVKLARKYGIPVREVY